MSDQAKRVALVAEGSTSLARLILDTLMRDHIACEVVLIGDGTEALDYLLCKGTYTGRDAHVMPCVTLLDLSLPRLDGLELLREMRAHEQTRLLPVVAFSSAAEPHQADAAYTAGANSYVGIKPGFGRFEERLREVAHYWCVLNEPPPNEPPPTL